MTLFPIKVTVRFFSAAEDGIRMMTIKSKDKKDTACLISQLIAPFV